MEFTEKETALISQIKTDAETLIAEKTSGLITENQFTEKMNELQNSNADASKAMQAQIEKLTTIAKEQGLKIQSINTNAPADANKAQVEQDFTAVKESLNKGGKEVVVKANYLRASVTNSTEAMRLNDFGQLGTRRLNLYNLFNKIQVAPESNGVVRYTDWDSATTVRAAAAASEGTAFAESTATFQEYTLALQKIGDTLPISEEVLMYTDRFASELERFLRTNISVVQDTQLLSGSGTAPNLRGVYTAAPTYTAAASGITDASIYDLIVKMSEGITTSNGSKYMPNFALMNIADINKMKLKKDVNKQYIIPPFATTGGQVVDGITVIEANGLTANTMVIGDSNFADIYEAGGYMVSAMPSGTQFAADLTTLKVKKHMALLIRKADETGFLKCTSISGALTTLAT